MKEKKEIDHGKSFDWGLTSIDYAKYRDIYPQEFYQRIQKLGLCNRGQTVLDLGTGTGVLPRNLYQYGAKFTGIDSSKNQIVQANRLAEEAGIKINFHCVPAEECDFADLSFDVITACQCFTYFDHKTLAPRLHRILKEYGQFAILYMAWLPFEDRIAADSEKLILKYNSQWTGGNETRHTILIPEVYKEYFVIEHQHVFDVQVPFTRESWHGRIKTCRGIEASLSDKEIAQFDLEHRNLLKESTPEAFDILHYVAITTMRKL